jgi:hypothetical protein
VFVILDALLLAAASLALYVATLAPTVTWGDDVTLQLRAIEGRLQASAGSHPLWVIVAHLFTRVPTGELAFRVNLVSAIFAATTIGILYLVLRSLRISRWASILAAIAFAVSHTFWAHAVRTEVYTLMLTTVALLLLMTLRWYQIGKRRYLVLMGISLGLSLTTHLLAMLYLPALAWLIISQRRRLRGGGFFLLVISTLIALLPLCVLLWVDAQRAHMGFGALVRWAIFTFDGYDFSGDMMRFSFASLPSDAAQWLLFLGYQFAGPAILLGFAGAWMSRKYLSRELATFVLLLYIGSTAFAFSYQVGDRYVFYLPSYLIFSIWVALGVQYILRVWNQQQRALFDFFLLVLLIIVPVVTYRSMPDVIAWFGVFQSHDVRRVPGPNSRYWLLWPSKANYFDARNYASAALGRAPVNALLLADPVLASPMQYLQRVEGIRSDVSIRFCCWDLEQTLASETERPIALADIWPTIYPVERFSREYEIVPESPIYLLVPRNR